jgi:rhodanese-related sulfurtransferase
VRPFALLAFLCLASPALAADDFRVMTTAELAPRLSGPPASWSLTVVDARTEVEFSEAHIPGAVLVPASRVGERLPKLVPDRARAVVFYCNGPNCTKTVKAAKAAAAAGYTNIAEYKEGLPGWGKAGHRIDGKPLPKVDAPLLSPQDLAAALAGPDAPLVVDIRDAEEFAAFHLAQARSVPIDELAKQLEALPGRSIVLVDHAGHQSPIAARLLASLGRPAKGRLDGGMLKWQAAGLSVIKGS